MSTYTYKLSNTAVNTSADMMTLIPASGHRCWIIEVSVGGMGSSSGANEIGVYRATAGGASGNAAITATKLSTDAPAATCPVYSSLTAGPSTLGGQLLSIPVNSNGGIYRWVARPGEELEFRGTNGDWCAIRGVSGSGNVSIHFVVVEDPA